MSNTAVWSRLRLMAALCLASIACGWGSGVFLVLVTLPWLHTNRDNKGARDMEKQDLIRQCHHDAAKPLMRLVQMGVLPMGEVMVLLKRIESTAYLGIPMDEQLSFEDELKKASGSDEYAGCDPADLFKIIAGSET